MQLAGKTAVITGAGSGIGRALAIDASKRGMTLALVGRRPDPLQETRRQLGHSADCVIIAADVTLPEGRRLIRDELVRAWGRLNVLVNNAGMVAAGPLSSMPDADLDRLLATNLSAPIALTRDLLPLLRASSSARIVNIGSLVGDIALPLFAAYSASKFGLRGLSNALRRELQGLGIGVTYVAPGGAQTDAANAVAHFTESLGMPPPASAASVASEVWSAVDRGTDDLYPRGRERLFVLVERLFPALITRALSRQLKSGGGLRLIDEDADLAAAAFGGTSAALKKH
jgi:short-subunit dehydrogenase